MYIIELGSGKIIKCIHVYTVEEVLHVFIILLCILNPFLLGTERPHPYKGWNCSQWWWYDWSWCIYWEWSDKVSTQFKIYVHGIQYKTLKNINSSYHGEVVRVHSRGVAWSLASPLGKWEWMFPAQKENLPVPDNWTAPAILQATSVEQ